MRDDDNPVAGVAASLFVLPILVMVAMVCAVFWLSCMVIAFVLGARQVGWDAAMDNLSKRGGV